MWQKKSKIIFLILFLVGLVYVPKAQAQMMRNYVPSVTPSQENLQDIQSGQNLYLKFQNKQETCSSLKDNDFEKIGEYVMNQSFNGNVNAHIQMNNIMKQMMGENGEEQAHIRLGKNATGCSTNSSTNGSVFNMMGWSYPSMMLWGGNFGSISIFSVSLWAVGFIDLIFLGILLLKKIQK